MKKYRTITKRITALLLISALFMSLLGGCGKLPGSENSAGNDGSTTEALQTGGDGSSPDAEGQSDNATAMGRYVEEVFELADRLSGTDTRLFRLASGELVIVDMNRGILTSNDNGATWEEDRNRTWQNRLTGEGNYIVDVVIGANNTTAVIYNNFNDQAGVEDYSPKLLLVKPDGTEIPVEIPVTGDEKYPADVGVADDGTVFVSVVGSSNLYEVKEDGSSELFLTVQNNRPELFQCQGNLIIMDGYGYSAPLIYDREKKEYIEDEVWKDLIHENYPKGNGYSGSYYSMYFFPGDEGVLYLAGEKGLHRHAIGGSVSEQVIDGSLCTLGNPIYEISGMVMLENNEFLTLFGGGRLVHYFYDPNASTVPNNQLKVYSLKESDTIRQAISLFQTANPDIFVKYDIGMEEGGSVTRDDALKSLNTKIIAGEGPDVLLLDDMPLDSYIEKGMLQDLRPIIDGLQGEERLFGNIVDAMKTGDSVYAMPLEVSIPMAAGDKKYISQLKDLKSIADTIEQLRKDLPGKDLLDICSEQGIMRMFAIVCEPAWITENGEIDKAAISEFLEQSKRIYDAQMDGLPEKVLEQYKKGNENWLEQIGEVREESKYFRRLSSVISYVGGLQYMDCGAVVDSNGYMNLASLNRTAGFENTIWAVMNGQCSNVFCAETLVGISAASKHTELAEDFVKLCFGKEAQTNLFNGLAVNKAAFEESFVVDESMVGPDGGYLFYGMSNEEGLSVTYTAYVVNDAQIAEFRKCLEAADTPYLKNSVLEETVYEAGTAYLQGRQSLDETVSAIEKKLALYLAE